MKTGTGCWKTPITLFCFAGTLLLSGCLRPPKDQSGKLAMAWPEKWSGAEEGFSEPYEDGWMGDFEDDQLAGLIGEALERNYNLQAAAARLEGARASAIIAGAGKWPQISANQSSSRRLRTGTTGFAITNRRNDSFAFSLDLSWEIDLWGRLRNRHRASLADWQASREDYRGARLSLAAQTAQAWFNAIEAELQVRLAEETVSSFEANLATIERRFRSGISRALDLRLTRANVAGARSSLETRKRQRDAAVRGLEVVLGRYPANQLRVVEKLPSIINPVPAGLPSELLGRRPDIAAAERRFAASGQRVSEAKKSHLPSIRLTAGGGTSTARFSDLVNSDFKVWSLFSGMAQPIFQGRRISASVKRAKANEEQALAEFAQTTLTAFREVESALASERYLFDQEAALLTAAEESIGAEELAWDQYQAGLNDIVTVLEAERRSFDSQRQLLQIRNQRLQNRVDLYLALGGEFEREDAGGGERSVLNPSPDPRGETFSKGE